MDEEYFIDDLGEDTEIKDVNIGKDSDGSTLDLSETQYTATDSNPTLTGGTKAGSYGSEQQYAPRDIIQIPTNIIDKGARAAYIALQDVYNPKTKTGTTSNLGLYRGNVGRKGHSVNEILARVGLGPGYAWCASATYTWWTEAGINSIPLKQNPAYVPNWVSWASKLNRWSKTPVVGALAVYGRDYHHIGIVVQVNPNGTVYTVEGNYSDSCKYLSPAYTTGISGFVIPG
jgi:hypothetical protein